MLKNSKLLITGGTGSFGNAVLERFINSSFQEIRIFSRDEKKQEDMRLKLNNEKVKYYIGDTRDYDSVLSAMSGVDYVFHAAALKQVPSCEFYPMQAVQTNILGSENVMKAAVAENISKLIVLSTDKAVYPINAMGLSKAMMEKLMVSKSRNIIGKTILTGTRYGNVMASRGSIIPLFVNQIKKGDALTITDPNMTRFLMSLDDAVDLVIHAFKNATQGDIFVQKAPASTIYDLACAIKDIFNAKSEIKIIGTRHGEKLYETLLTREERVKATETKNYFRVSADNRNLNYNKYFVDGEIGISSEEDYNSHNTERLDIPKIKELLLKLDFIKSELTR